ncbi:zinc finger MYM-type protein 1-like [Gadus chalcogrammus]|uniref:zinc finger MYM-type protein 1-like n=1 Tax=Gadus chalcogrammus TaxID=1042646 RepID=UPI0024C4BBF5|nr:zinc finger MYM-type protein 1-like [Gadus chalcogrammus]
MHEAGQPHRKAALTWLARTQVCGIDAGLQDQLKDEANYWKEVLRRVVAVIKFLSERGLAFRGENETLGSVHNGNYLGILELLAKFDPFLDEHLKRFGNKGRGTPSYLSSTVCTEFIALMGQRVQSEIIMQLQHAKYFSLIVDSTPDLSHTDQLTFVVRYVSQEGKIFERFLKFLPIFSHTGESLFDSVTGVLQDMHIDIKNCRGQCYDNASNMAGAYKGLRARIQEINPLADWIPCAAHSLNLVGVCSVDCCRDASSFFRLVQSIFTFFSASPSRWKILMDGLESNENKRMEMVKGLSSTRWAAHARATKALRLNLKNIHDTLNEIAEDDHQKSAARDEAKSLAKKLNRFETAFLAIIWDTVLQRFDITSRALQTVELDLVTAVELLQSLIDFVSNLRSQYKHLESQAKSLSLSQQYTVTRQVKRTGTTPADDTDEPTLVSNAGENRFRETFFVIIDKLISALQQRHAVYKETSTYFGFLTQLDTLSLSEIREKSVNLQAKYHEDLADDFPDELGQFLHFAKSPL